MLSLFFTVLKVCFWILFWILKVMLRLTWYLVVLLIRLLPSLRKATAELVDGAVDALTPLFSPVANSTGGVTNKVRRKRNQKPASVRVPPVVIAVARSSSTSRQNSADTSGERLKASRGRKPSPTSSPFVMTSSSPVAVAGEPDQMSSTIPESTHATFVVGPDPRFADNMKRDWAKPASNPPHHVVIPIVFDATSGGPATDSIGEPFGIPNPFAPRAQTLGWTAFGIAIAGSALIILGVFIHALILFLGLGLFIFAPASGVLAILAVVFGGIGLRRRRLQHRRSAAKRGLALGIVAFCLPTITLVVASVISVG